MQLHVPLDQTVRLRYRHTYQFGGATITLRAQSAFIEHPDPQVCESLKITLLGQWLPDGIYRGTLTGARKSVGPDD